MAFMDIIIVFHGGPLDGVTMSSDAADELERLKVQRMAQVIGGCLRDAEKREVEFNPGLTYTVPSEMIMDQAKKENWPHAKIQALMPYYVYEYWKHQETDGIAQISLRFKTNL
jgi:hypothetical protein